MKLHLIKKIQLDSQLKVEKVLFVSISSFSSLKPTAGRSRHSLPKDSLVKCGHLFFLTVVGSTAFRLGWTGGSYLCPAPLLPDAGTVLSALG